MRTFKQALALAALSATVMAAPAAIAGDDINVNHFQAMCDTNKDGMVSKAEAMKMVEKMFDKHDKAKSGKLDKKQVEFFLKELMKGGA